MVPIPPPPAPHPPLSGKRHRGRPPRLDRRMPWAIGDIGVRPCGLRERVLRAAYLPDAEASRIANTRDPQLQTVLTWRRDHPKQFAELCRMLAVPERA